MMEKKENYYKQQKKFYKHNKYNKQKNTLQSNTEEKNPNNDKHIDNVSESNDTVNTKKHNTQYQKQKTNIVKTTDRSQNDKRKDNNNNERREHNKFAQKNTEPDNNSEAVNKTVGSNSEAKGTEVIFLESPAETDKPSIPENAVKIGPPELELFDFKDENNINTVDAGDTFNEVIGVQFRQSGKMYYFSSKGIKVHEGDNVIVETARGDEFGKVCCSNKMVSEKNLVLPLRSVLRVATKADIEHNEQNKKKEEEAFNVCLEKIKKHGLEMKLVDTQYTFDNSKLLFYFTAAGRVDFRELVKDLASVFRTRIELRQIGIRDEAKLLGGLGACGRPLCCTTFLPDFAQVSIKMAKEQNLSLNSNKISGSCSRLMCCLRYENDVYEEEIKKLPPVESVVRTSDGVGTVIELSPLTGLVKVKLNDDNIIKYYDKDGIDIITRAKQIDDKDDESEI